MRLAVGGFLHESHSFAPRPATYDEFLAPGGWPKLTRGAAMFDAVRGCANAIAGAIAASDGAELVPLLWCMASPSAPITANAFERIAAALCDELASALPVDGVYLDLHGAAMAEGAPDAEGELLRRIRAIVGPDVPVTASLDPHANLTAAMVGYSDALCPYLTYPHIDMRDAGARAMRLLLRAVRGERFAAAFRQLPFFIPLTSQCTLAAPMDSVMARRAELAGGAAELAGGAAELAWCFGFPYADFADCGPALCAYATTQAEADRVADEFAAELQGMEARFAGDVRPAKAAVAEALAWNGARPVVLADTQDNPGGGGHGDTTGLLAELVAQGARGAVVCLLNDPASASACHAAGEGAELDLALGGVSDGAPFGTRARVLRLASGPFALTGPMTGGNTADLGPCALIEVEGGVRVMLASRKIQALDRAILAHVGVDAREPPILALKSSVHFRADFGPVAGHIIVAAAPGPVTADPAELPFRFLRPGVRLSPAQ